RSLLTEIFRKHPSSRGRIVSSCLAVVGTYRLPASRAGIPSGSRPASVRGEDASDQHLRSCARALGLLHHLARRCPRMLAPFAHSVSDLLLGGGGGGGRRRHPILLGGTARCLALLTPYASGLCNTLLNHVHKQLFVVGVGNVPGWGSSSMVRGAHGPLAQSPTASDPPHWESALLLATHLVRQGQGHGLSGQRRGSGRLGSATEQQQGG
ncbi:unnamed protein product, partial [Discosporangium mesarthrocarpum]